MGKTQNSNVITSERRDHATPNGGVYSIAYYLDNNRNPAPKDRATQVEIWEFDKDDKEVYQTNMKLRQN